MKQVVYIVLLACVALLASCAASPQEQNKRIAQRVFDEILTQGNFALAEQLYAPDFVNRGITRDVDLKEDQAWARGWRQAFPDGTMLVEKVMAEGDLVTVLWRGRGTNTGTGNGLPATGRPVELRGITIWRIQGGKIKEEWSSFDQLSLMRQLGLLPTPGAK
jgi:steroid delta-isomerase-like uncharacterized protein